MMFDEYNDLNNYMTYDSSSLNQCSFKYMDDVFPVHQNMKIFIILLDKLLVIQYHYQM